MNTQQTPRQQGTEASERARCKAERVCPGFSERAYAFIQNYAREHERFSGEVCTLAMKEAGIRGTDDRCTGAIYAKAIRNGVIRVVGYVPRARGHGTAGGRLYSSAQ